MAAMAAFNIGDTIGDYQVVGQLGVGGMGTVYRVRNVISDREDALKVLLPDLRAELDVAERFAREIKIQASLDHPNIASLRTALRIDNQLLMIMELVEGVTLERRLREGPIDLWQAIDWMTEVLAALVYAHSLGVVHRDIKPANIMITRANKVKLMDFGIARSVVISGVTVSGVAVGSVHYMPPEVIDAAAPDARSDLYSLGVTCYELVAGRRPFQGRSHYEIMKAHLEAPPTSPGLINPDVPPELAAAILRAMAKHPDDRFQSAAEFRSALLCFRGAEKTVASSLLQLAGPAKEPTDVPSSLDIQARTPPAARSGSNGQANWSLEPAVLERVTSDLARYIGPVARILVTRAAKESASFVQFYARLADEIPSLADRVKFLELSRRF